MFLVALGVLGAVAVRAWAVEGIYIASASMEPTLPVGTHLILDKVTPRLRGLRRGDIVAFPAPIPPHKPMVKRVIAIGGETVELRKKKVFIDGKPIEEPYARYTRPGEELLGDEFGPLEVPAGSLFVLGDNRDESEDSTQWAKSSYEVAFVRAARVDGLVRGVY